MRAVFLETTVSLLIVVMLMACIPVGAADSDNDGVDDALDAFPNNPYEQTDTDGDGVGDNLDTDADGDGTDDDRDAFPLDSTETMDTDSDGIGNNADTDDDNDGVPDASDAFPLNAYEYMDSDGDGIGDRMDPDDDNDGVPDEQEILAAITANVTTITNAMDLVHDTIEGDLDRLNASLSQTMTTMKAGFVAELRSVNDTLADEIQDAVNAINSDLNSLGVTVSGDIDDLDAWLKSVMDALGVELAQTSTSFQSHLMEMDERVTGFYEDLDSDLSVVRLQLARVEGNLSAGNDGIRADIATLSEMTTNLNENTLNSVSDLLASLAEDIAEFDAETALLLKDVSADIAAFQSATEGDISDINQTLEDLSKLNDILDELGSLDQSLEDAETELDRSVQDSSEETMAQGSTNMMLVVIVLVLLVVILVLVLRMRGPRKAPDEFKPVTEDDAGI